MMNIIVIGASFVDIKGFPQEAYIPDGRNVGRIEYIHGGVARNVVEDIANVELRPTYLGIVDNTPLGYDVLKKLNSHKINTNYVMQLPDGMGTWLAVFDNNGDVAGSISKRPNMLPLVGLIDGKGDEIFSNCDSVVIEVDINREIVKRVIDYSKKYGFKIFGLVSNMSIAAERRDFLKDFDCFICNRQEAGLLFQDDYSECNAEELSEILRNKVMSAQIPSMVVTMGADGAVYATKDGENGTCEARKVHVKDTTGAGDAFCAGVSIGLTFNKPMTEAIEMGSFLAASVISSSENVCPRFLPSELGIEFEVLD